MSFFSRWSKVIKEMPLDLKKAGNDPYANTHCPYCGAAEPDWNGRNSDPEFHDLLTQQDDEIARLRQIVAAPLSSAELRLVDKNCDWIAFGHAWNAVMKRRQEQVDNDGDAAQSVRHG